MQTAVARACHFLGLLLFAGALVMTGTLGFSVEGAIGPLIVAALGMAVLVAKWLMHPVSVSGPPHPARASRPGPSSGEHPAG